MFVVRPALLAQTTLVNAENVLVSEGDWIERATQHLIAWLPAVVAALVILVLGVFIAKLVNSSSRTLLRRAHVDETLAKFVANLAYFALLGLVVITALGKLGVETTSFVAVIGAAGLALGLALQGSLGNLAAGAMLLIFKPFRVGDTVFVAGHEGGVEEIGVFATTLATPDNKRVIVPNAAITSGAITNLTGNPARRVEIVLHLAWSNDAARTRAILLDVLRAHPDVHATPAPGVAVASIDAGVLKLSLTAWCAATRAGGITTDLNEALKTALERERITFPVPLQQVRQV